MENNKFEISEVIQGWQNICFEIKRGQNIDFGFFKDVFSKTYSLLSQHSSESNLDKDCVRLVAEAFLFANADIKTADSRLLAAMVLTERMINCCAFKSVNSLDDCSTVYILESRKEAHINFNDVGESLTALEKIFQEQLSKAF